jgi:hypothetical protein
VLFNTQYTYGHDVIFHDISYRPVLITDASTSSTYIPYIPKTDCITFGQCNFVVGRLEWGVGIECPPNVSETSNEKGISITVNFVDKGRSSVSKGPFEIVFNPDQIRNRLDRLVSAAIDAMEKHPEIIFKIRIGYCPDDFCCNIFPLFPPYKLKGEDALHILSRLSRTNNLLRRVSHIDFSNCEVRLEDVNRWAEQLNIGTSVILGK